MLMLYSVTDLLVVVLPMPIIYRLQLPTQQQMGIIVLFGVGFLVTLAGAVRTVFLFRTTESFDKTWLAYPVYIASSVELYIGIVRNLHHYPEELKLMRQLRSVPPSLQPKPSSHTSSPNS